MTTAKAKQIFRVGDTVKIVNPAFFIRCGYPYDIRYAIDNLISKEEKDAILNIIRVGCFFKGDLNYRKLKEYDQIINKIAFCKLLDSGFGGNKREIHSIKEDSFLNKTARVISKRVVKTGIRENEYSSSYDGEYQPPYLVNEKTHVILKIVIDSEEREFITLYEEKEIEANNVEKINNE